MSSRAPRAWVSGRGGRWDDGRGGARNLLVTRGMGLGKCAALRPLTTLADATGDARPGSASPPSCCAIRASWRSAGIVSIGYTDLPGDFLTQTLQT